MRKLIRYSIMIVFMIYTIFYTQHLVVYSADDFQFESVVTNPAVLTEENLKWAEIRLKITDDDIIKDPMNPSDVHIHSQPGGVSVESVTRIDDHTIKMKLDYDWQDFDADDNDFFVDTGGGLTINGYTFGEWVLPIKATVESKNSLKALTNPPLTESNLNGAQITLVLSDHDFEGSVNSSQFILNNAPPGLSIASVTKGTNNRVAILTLAFDGTDFDADIPNFSITALDAAHKGNYDVTSNDLPIKANYEGPVSMGVTTIPNKLYENNLDGSVLRLNLSNDAFASSLTTEDIILINGPTGISVSNVERFSNTEALVTLGFDGTDFDVDISDFSVEVSSSGLSTAPYASSNTMMIYSVEEIEGLGNYISTGTSYPTLIEMTGHNSKGQKLYINSELHTEKDVTGKTATFNYYIKVYDGNGNTIGNLGDITAPLSVTANAEASEVNLKNIEIQLNRDLPVDYRIVVIVESINIL